MRCAAGPMARAPEHGHPDDGYESELSHDDGDLSEVCELIEDSLHRDPPFPLL